MLTDDNIQAGINGVPFAPPFEKPLSLELALTDTYRKFRTAPPAQREAEFLRVQLPAILQPIQPGDLLAGRVRYGLVGFSPEPMGLGFYCLEGPIREALGKLPFSEEERCRVEEMLSFWKDETTQAKTIAAYPESIRRALGMGDWTVDSGIAFPLYRMGGITLDYGKLLQLGIPGLLDLVQARGRRAADRQTCSLCLGMLTTLDTLASLCRRSASEARELGDGQIAEVLEALVLRAPQTFREAMQLFWLYAVLSGTWNYGRMDVYLGPFLANDLRSGRLTRDEALTLMQSLWRLIAAYDNMYNNRVFIGGKGRPDEKAVDQFALLAIEATRTVPLNQPQLSLRFYDGQNPELMNAALSCLGEGRTFPILYNDDVNIPAVAAAFGVSPEVALEYTPYGCGEYAINHAGTGSPNGVINLLKCLEVTLHNGVDPVNRQPGGLATGDPAQFRSFEDLWSAYARQVEYHIEALALQEKIEYDVAGEAAPFLLISLLFDDCVERGNGVFGGGARYLGGTVETYGNINASDSLAAIHKLVYEDRACTLADLVRACDANFEGHDTLRRRMLDAPKFGNDEEQADAMAVRVHEHVCTSASEQAPRVGLDTYLVVVINNWANTLFGRTTAASPDGRRFGEPLANAINPTSGRDRNGVTAFLNSLVKMNPAIHAGTVQNMKFSRGMFTGQRTKLEALLHGYFRSGGTQAMITVVDRRDLEEAMRESEKWGHLMVRVGGFSARFIDLPHDVQLEVLSRTLNE